MSPAPQMIRPVTVPKIETAADPTSPNTVITSRRLSPLTTDLATIQGKMVEQQFAIDSLQKQLEEGVRQKQRLLLAQRLVSGIANLHKAERTLGHLDGKIQATQRAAKELTDKLAEIADADRRSEMDRQREARDRSTKLDELQAGTGAETKVVRELTEKRVAVVAAIEKWKEYVSRLRDDQQTLAMGDVSLLRGASSLGVDLPPLRFGGERGRATDAARC
jgi:chromosome segregation ATPase